MLKNSLIGYQRNSAAKTKINIIMPSNHCCVCNACGCGVTLYEVAGKFYCAKDKPVIKPAGKDNQTLTLQQKMNLNNGR